MSESLERGLVLRPPPFLSSVCIHNNTWEWKTIEKEGVFRSRVLCILVSANERYVKTGET